MAENKPNGKQSNTWGARVRDILNGAMPVQVAVLDKVYNGMLIGYDVYDVVLRQDSGAILVCPKSNIRYIMPIASA